MSFTKVRTKLAAGLSAAAVLIGIAAFAPGAATEAHAVSNPVFYNGQHPSTQSVTNGSITQSSYLEANGIQSNTAEGSNNNVIIDRDQIASAANFDAVFTFHATASTPFNTVLELPRYSDAQSPFVVDESKIADTSIELPHTGTASGLSVSYSSAPGDYDDFGTWKDAPHSWDSLIALQVQGTFQAGTDFSIKVPLKLTNPTSEIYTDPFATIISTESFDSNGDTIYDSELQARLAEPALLADNQTPYLSDVDGTTQYMATLRTGDHQYSLLPKKNGATNPAQTHIAPMQQSDFTVENLPSDNSWSPVLYTGSSWHIKLDNIKKSVAPYGYSVAVNPQGDQPDNANQLYTSYEYSAIGKSIVLTDADGKPIDNPPTNAQPTTGKISNAQYVELRPVVSSHNVTITQGDNWNNANVLDWVKSHAGANLTADQLNDTSLVTVTSNVDPNKPGTYTVTYTYVPDGVSDTATVTVKPKTPTLPAPGQNGGSAVTTNSGPSVKPTSLAKTGSEVIVPAALAAVAFGLGAAGITLARKRAQH